MKELRRLLAISILMVSLFGAALAEGGDTHGPPAPAPECSADCSSTAASIPAQPAEDSTADIVTPTELFAAWFAMSIL